MTAELARRQTVTELVAVYERSCSEIRSGFALVSTAIHRLNNELADGTTGRFYADGGRSCRYPDFDRVDSVMAFADGYLAAIPEMLAEAVTEVFEWLRPRHGRAAEMKTNSQFEVPKKVIVWAVDRGWSNEHFRVSYHRESNVTALENVFTALDGQGQVTRCYRSDLSNAIRDAGPGGKGETRYFKFRACKNGHLHITFKRTDLLAKFNRIAGGKRLRE